MGVNWCLIDRDRKYVTIVSEQDKPDVESSV